MAQERIKDKNGKTIGFVETNSQGKSTLFDSHSLPIGTESKSGHVRNNHAQTVCYGKGSLMTLLGK